MDFSISTKYNIGDEVYAAEFYEEYVPSDKFVITNIEISINDNRTKILYHLSQDNEFKTYYIEDLVFATYEECTKWCEERNENS